MATRRFTYVSAESYRWRYRQLETWQRRWHRYERRHPSDASGLPVDQHAHRTITVRDNNDLEALIYRACDGKVCERTHSLRLIETDEAGGMHIGRSLMVRTDDSRIELFKDPLRWMILSIRIKRLLRMNPIQLSRLVIKRALAGGHYAAQR